MNRWFGNRWFSRFFLRQKGGHHRELKQRHYSNGPYQVVSSQHVTRSPWPLEENSDDPVFCCHFNFDGGPYYTLGRMAPVTARLHARFAVRNAFSMSV